MVCIYVIAGHVFSVNASVLSKEGLFPYYLRRVNYPISDGLGEIRKGKFSFVLGTIIKLCGGILNYLN